MKFDQRGFESWWCRLATSQQHTYHLGCCHTHHTPTHVHMLYAHAHFQCMCVCVFVLTLPPALVPAVCVCVVHVRRRRRKVIIDTHIIINHAIYDDIMHKLTSFPEFILFISSTFGW